ANAKATIVPNYVTESGFTEDINTRTKVGAPQNAQEFFVYDIKRDTVIQVKTDDIPGIMEKPAYLAGKDDGKEKKPQPRAVSFFATIWSPDGKHAALQIRAGDNKDRWIMKLDVATQILSLLTQQHDGAWIGGPGSWSLGWISNRE